MEEDKPLHVTCTLHANTDNLGQRSDSPHMLSPTAGQEAASPQDRAATAAFNGW